MGPPEKGKEQGHEGMEGCCGMWMFLCLHLVLLLVLALPAAAAPVFDAIATIKVCEWHEYPHCASLVLV